MYKSTQTNISIIKIIYFFFIGLMFVSCNPLEQPPSTKNSSKALAKFYQDSSKYTKSQIQFMEGFTAMLESEEKFEENIKFNVTSESYDSIINSMVKYFEQNDYNYNYLLDCEAISEDLNNQKNEELESIAKEIDKECQKRQAEMDRIDRILNNAMTTKLTRLKTGYSEGDGSYVEFKVVDSNLSGKTISGRKVLITFYDGFNNKIHSTNLTGSNAFNKTDIGYLTYYKERNPEEYRKFANMKMSSFKITTKNKTLNIDNEIISYPSWTYVNFDYQSTGTPSTYCPYIELSEDNEPLQEKVEQTKEKYDKMLKSKCKGFEEMISNYFSKIKSE
ncbi:MAG: hypothetical protein P1U56_25175 [Saprospiraceae bacterium]|nr:hypothetical protein [Saprospiraceae bacterium]